MQQWLVVTVFRQCWRSAAIRLIHKISLSASWTGAGSDQVRRQRGMQAPPNNSFEPNRFIGTGDARRVAERLASCSHFSGELDGDRSDREKEVAAAIVALSCEPPIKTFLRCERSMRMTGLLKRP